MWVALGSVVVVICWMLSAAIAAIGVYLFRRMQQPRGPLVRRAGSPRADTNEPTDRWLEELCAAIPEPDLMPPSTHAEPRSPLFQPRMARGSTPPFGQAQTRAGSVQPVRPQTERTGEEITQTDTIIVDPSLFEDSSTSN